MLRMTFLSRTNPPIRQKIPRFFVSLSEGSRAPGIQDSGKPSSTLPESTLSDKPKVLGSMTVRFPTIRRLTVVGLKFSNEIRTNSPSLRLKSRGEICIEPGAIEDSSIGTSQSRRTGSETGSDLDGNRVGVFHDGSTTIPEGNSGTKEGATVF